ncbi:MAG: DUF72 domain-containing protein [Bacteroidetes bacterium]|nr:MAG: DUF72 domain-containing protein [Bacteroidota bacterium]
MEFGKLPAVDLVDFTLPPDPEQNSHVLRHGGKQHGKKNLLLYLGATGYNMKPWVGRWYPAGTRDKAFLKFYGQQFNTIEHNTTHYRIPDASTIDRWYTEVPVDFRYCPKIPQTISHSRDLGVNGPEIGLFCNTIEGLQEKLGCCFIQLPPYFSLSHLPVLERFLRRFPTGTIPLAVEVRHESFFQNNPLAEEYYHLLELHGVSTVITDVAGRRDVCHMRLTTDKVLVRFVGNGLHPTDFSRIEDWAERVKHWFDQGLTEVYFFCHEPDNLLAPDLTKYAVSAFSKVLPDAILRGPEPYTPPPEQGSLF